MAIVFKTRGKVPNDKANFLLNAMLDVAKVKKAELANGVKANNFTLDQIGHPTFYSTLYNSLERLARFDLQYCSVTHPAYSEWKDIHDKTQPARERLIPYCGWTLEKDYYVNGCNDDHWHTVQKQVKNQFVKEIQNILKGEF